MNRRDCLRVLLASALAESVDFERLLWTPKPIIVVPPFQNVEIAFEQYLENGFRQMIAGIEALVTDLERGLATTVDDAMMIHQFYADGEIG